MKASFKTLLAASLLGAGLLASAPASAQPTSFSFRLGDVAVGYSDGYYDRNRNWHSWRNAREHNWYRVNQRGYYRSMRHDRDRDGVPDRFDRRPNNPYRR